MRVLRCALMLGLVGSGAALARAEDLTISTYYPSPRGVYQELRTTNNTYLATQGGAVGIGTTAPAAGAQLHIANAAGSAMMVLDANFGTNYYLFQRTESGCAGCLYIGRAGSEDAPDLLIDQSGRVGIGTAAPNYTLEVNGTSRLGSSSAGAVYIKTGGASLGIIRPAVSNGSLLISDDSEVAARGLTIANGGNVGIGTTSPERKLHISDSVAGLSYPLVVSNPNADAVNYGPAILFRAGTGDNRAKGGIAYVYDSDASWNKGDFHFLQNSASDTSIPTLSNTVMTIKNNGKVGIGTASPGATLDTVGLIRATNVGAALNPASGKGLEIQYVISGRAQGEGAYLIPYDRTANAYKPFTIDALNMNFSTGGLTRMVIVPNGSVMISDLAGNFAPGNSDRFQVNGNIYAMGTIHAQSDIRFKANIEPLAGTLGKLDQLRAVSYERNELGKSGGSPDGNREFGVIGQELQEVFPELVSTGSTPEKYLSVDYSRLSVVLLEAVKELKAETETLRSEVRVLKAEQHKELKP